MVFTIFIDNINVMTLSIDQNRPNDYMKMKAYFLVRNK